MNPQRQTGIALLSFLLYGVVACGLLLSAGSSYAASHKQYTGKDLATLDVYADYEVSKVKLWIDGKVAAKHRQGIQGMRSYIGFFQIQPGSHTLKFKVWGTLPYKLGGGKTSNTAKIDGTFLENVHYKMSITTTKVDVSATRHTIILALGAVFSDARCGKRGDGAILETRLVGVGTNYDVGGPSSKYPFGYGQCFHMSGAGGHCTGHIVTRVARIPVTNAKEVLIVVENFRKIFPKEPLQITVVLCETDEPKVVTLNAVK